jgi:hypothetical protein
MKTSELKRSLIGALKTWPGTGAVVGGEPGMTTMWVSTAVILSPCFAAGWLIVSSG